MTPEALETILSDPGRAELHSTAYAALTLTRLLAPEWTHVVVTKMKKGPDHHERVSKPAGQTVGNREELQKRLDVLLGKLSGDRPPLTDEELAEEARRWLPENRPENLTDAGWFDVPNVKP